MKTKDICITGLGIALFVVWSYILRVPVFQNYYLCLGYIVMLIYLRYFGTLSGTLVGFFGTLLYCILTGGLRGMPGWCLGNVVIGICIGETFKVLDKWTKDAVDKVALRILIISEVFIIVASTCAGILGVKSLVECVLYGIPFAVRVATNSYAFIADSFVLLFAYGLSNFHIAFRKSVKVIAKNE